MDLSWRFSMRESRQIPDVLEASWLASVKLFAAAAQQILHELVDIQQFVVAE
jgi:hypothetical protein